MNFERIRQVSRQAEELRARLQEPEIWQDPALSSRCQKELQELAPLADAYARWEAAGRELEGLEEMLSDPDLRALAAEEQQQLLRRRAEEEEQMKLLLLPADPRDGRNVILEIRAGVGGEESALFAADLFRMYTLYAESRHWKIETVYAYETELGGLKEISFVVEGEGAFSRLKFEGGGHRVQRVPVTESGGRIHTSAATVAVLPQVEEVDFQLNMNELKIDTYRSSGAGGQHVNKTESAIRVTHLPTGLVVECQDERSQYKNKDRALSVMRAKLYEREQEAQRSALAAERKSQIGSGDRSDRIRTYNFPQNRVTDHRLSGEGRSFNLESILNGGLDPLLDALRTQDQAERLAAGEKEDSV
ncbi:MAG: peptide chain release factor 1 [Oscillospiraceae bacterium]|nr:peptide chain release factor 1 [Oscillospiraceae bacterium]